MTHISFHTPGHNGGVSVTEDSRESGTFFDTRYDVTELSYTDNLLETSGVLRDLERRAAEAFGAEELFLFTNGATGAVFAAIAATEGKIAVVGQAHVSVYRALSLFRKRAVYCRDLDALSEYLTKARTGQAERVAAIFATSPDYFGNSENLAAFRAAADAEDAALIVDASHGSHFAFCKKFPKRATEYGDLVIYSLHKTLPVLTGSAAIAVKRAYAEAAYEARRLTHTTSPSYPVLLSVEAAISKLRHGETDYEEVFSLLEYFREDIKHTSFRILENDDPTRLIVGCGFDGAELTAALEEFGIFAECSFRNAAVFIVTPYNKQYLPYLADALKTIAARRSKERKNKGESAESGVIRSDAGARDGILTLKGNDFEGVLEREADDFPNPPEIKELLPFAERSEAVEIENAEGRILNAPLGLYPPGVPLFFAGDVVSRNMIAFIKKNRSRMFGLARKGVSVVK